MLVFPSCPRFRFILKYSSISEPPCYPCLLQYSQHIATERSFSRLPTHPYAQWWNVTFITINNSSFLPFLVSGFYTVILESVEEWSPEDLPLFLLFRSNVKCLSIPGCQHICVLHLAPEYPHRISA